MSLTIDRDRLSAMLAPAKAIVPTRGSDEILRLGLLSARQAGPVTLTVTDRERWLAQTRMGEGGEDVEPFLVDVARLAAIVREMPPGMVTISTDTKRPIITAGAVRFALNDGGEVKGFPAAAFKPVEGAAPIAPGILRGALERTRFSASRDETRPHLHGVHFESKDGTLTSVATDGHRLTVFRQAVDFGPLNCLVPAGSIDAILGLLEDDDVACEFRVDASSINVSTFAHPESMLSQVADLRVRKIEGEFPDYRQVIPARSNTVVTVDGDSLRSALRRVVVIASERTRGVKIQVADGAMQLSTMNPDCGEAEETIDCEVDGPPVTMGFNAKYLLDGIAACDGDRICIGLIDEVSPGMIWSAADTGKPPGWVHCVMPMRI